MPPSFTARPTAISTRTGVFHRERQAPSDKPVYEVELRPEDGLYPLPYMARQADGQRVGGGLRHARARRRERRGSASIPTARGCFEEIDRLGIGENGVGNLISATADVDFYRVVPAGRLHQGAAGGAAHRRRRGRHRARDARARLLPLQARITCGAAPPRPALARIDQRGAAHPGERHSTTARSGPRAARASRRRSTGSTCSIDTHVPICGNAAQRPHGQISNDGTEEHRRFGRLHRLAGVGGRGGPQPRRRRADPGAARLRRARRAEGRCAARRLRRDRRPWRHHRRVGPDGPPVLTYLPATRHTYLSDGECHAAAARRSRRAARGGGSRRSRCRSRTRDGDAARERHPARSRSSRTATTPPTTTTTIPTREVELLAQIERKLAAQRRSPASSSRACRPMAG